MSKKTRLTLLPLLFALLLAALLYKFWERWLHLLLLYLSTAKWARAAVGSMPIAWKVANRFVAGENVEDALTAVRTLNKQGLLVTMDYLGESVSSPAEAVAATEQILTLFDRIEESGVNANVSVKLSQLGLNIDPDLAQDNVRQLLERAAQYDNKLRIDMEDSPVTDQTFQIYRALRDEGGFSHRVGIVIQSYLYRTAEDTRQLIDEGAWVRLCKGAYAEPAEVAFPAKADTDKSYVALMQMLLSEQARQNGVYLGVATHDEQMIAATQAYTTAEAIPPDAFEFQMLYGVRRELQGRLAAQGYRVRVYVPYGTAWYPYFVRRLAERPANLWFFISNFLKK